MLPWNLHPNMVEDDTKWPEDSDVMNFWRKLPYATSMGDVVCMAALTGAIRAYYLPEAQRLVQEHEVQGNSQEYKAVMNVRRQLSTAKWMLTKARVLARPWLPFSWCDIDNPLHGHSGLCVITMHTRGVCGKIRGYVSIASPR